MNTNADKQKRLPIFRERLNILKGHMTIDRLAEKVGVRRSTMGFYLAGQRLPKADDLKKIAVACNVSTDYLVGLSAWIIMESVKLRGLRMSLSTSCGKQSMICCSEIHMTN